MGSSPPKKSEKNFSKQNSFSLKNKRSQLKEDIIRYFLIAAAAISILTTFGILFSILFEAS